VQSDSQLASRMVHRWYQVLGSHQNATIFAVNYNEAQLRAKTFLSWRLRLRSTLQSLRVARLADRFFATRRAWRLWLKKLEERKRLERFKAWNIARVRRAFSGKYNSSFVDLGRFLCSLATPYQEGAIFETL
jgi:protein SFI1